MRRKKDFGEDIKIKCLLWSDRHCCLCKKSCGTDIEIAHIDPNGGNDLGNAIPLCYDCHSTIGKYNKEHPRGMKFKPKELRTRRDQVYEEYTRHLVPPIDYQIIPRAQDTKKINLPHVGFIITHLGDSLPVRVRIKVRVFLGGKELEPIDDKPYYAEGIMWNLNPRHTTWGNFSVPTKCVDSKKDLQLEVKLTILDQYDRPHELLPICYTYVRDGKYWFTEPTSFSELKPFLIRTLEKTSKRH